VSRRRRQQSVISQCLTRINEAISTLVGRVSPAARSHEASDLDSVFRRLAERPVELGAAGVSLRSTHVRMVVEWDSPYTTALTAIEGLPRPRFVIARGREARG
jgi:hypothetical protein